MKKGDIIIILSVLVLSITSAFIFISGGDANSVTVKKNDKIIYRGSIYENKTIDTNGNIVEIKGGKVKVTSATCKNQICVNHREIDKKGESIVCLPNMVIVEIK